MSMQTEFFEKELARTLRMAGLKPKANLKIRGYDVGVYIQAKGSKIGFNCRYCRDSKEVRAFLHEWASKKRDVGLDKIVLIIVGSDINYGVERLAKRHELTIWDSDVFEDLIKKASSRKKGSKEG